jgi:hypothetical protein
MQNDLVKFIEAHKPTGDFQPNVLVDPENKRASVFLEDVPYYGEWIKGEDGDIVLYRAQEDDRVIGAFLPLRKWDGVFPVSII